jgi:hypothetical protein
VIPLPDGERRQYERYPQVFDIHAKCLLSARTTNDQPKEFEGRIQNLSNGGACILSTCPLEPTAFVCCKLPMAESPVSVPLLMQVRWTTKRGRKSPNYISGFQFVL